MSCLTRVVESKSYDQSQCGKGLRKRQRINAAIPLSERSVALGGGV